KLVCKSRLYIVASPDYLALKGTPTQPEELEHHDLIGFTRPTYINSWPIKVGDQYFFAQSKIKASSGETVRQLTIRGHGIARLSEFEIWKDMEEGRLIALFEDKIEHQYQSIHAVYYQQEHLPKRIRLFIEFLAEQLKDGFKNAL
ncbi:LysR family transcriptional regulator, partial [Acinetobacter baumannii]